MLCIRMYQLHIMKNMIRMLYFNVCMWYFFYIHHKDCAWFYSYACLCMVLFIYTPTFPPAFTYLKSAIATAQQCVKYVHQNDADAESLFIICIKIDMSMDILT